MANLNENYTLSYGGHFIADGGSYDLVLPFQPDKLEVWNYTKFGTTGQLPHSVWFRDFPAGDALQLQVIADDGTTSNTNLVLETTNGISENNSAGGESDRHVAISGATAADPVVITTSAAHGLSSGDRVQINKVLGMTELNSPARNPYQVTVLSTTTFSLQDIYGNDIDGSSFTAYSSGGQVTKVTATGADAYSYAAPVYRLSLGSAVYGSASDVIYFVAWKFGEYVNLGSIA